MNEPLVSLIGEHHSDSQLPKEHCPQRKLLKEHEHSWNAYYGRVGGEALRPMVAHKHFLSLLKEIGENPVGGLPFLLLISVTDTAVEGFESASDGDPSYLTVVGTVLAFEVLDVIFAVYEVESDETALAIFTFPFHGDQRSTDGASYIVVLRDGNPLSQNILEGSHHTLVTGYTSLETYPLANLLVPHHLLDVIIGNRIGKPR